MGNHRAKSRATVHIGSSHAQEKDLRTPRDSADASLVRKVETTQSSKKPRMSGSRQTTPRPSSASKPDGEPASVVTSELSRKKAHLVFPSRKSKRQSEMTVAPRGSEIG